MDVSIQYGDDEFNLAKMRRLIDKKERFGQDALSDDEFYTLAKFEAASKIIGRKILGTGQKRADALHGFELFEGLSDDEKEKFGNWKPDEFAAWWDIYKEHREKGD